MFSSMYQPSPYYPLQAAYRPIQPLSPRDKYLAAVAEAETARASYLADEAARREEAALQQRLDELRARRQRFSAPGPVDPGDRRLYELRREVEEEERRQRELALAAEEERREQELARVRWEIEEQARREERRRLIVEGGSRPYPHHQHVARQSRPAVVEFVIDEPHQAPTPDVRHSIEVDIQELLGQLSGLGNGQAQEPLQRSAQTLACARPSALAKARAEAWKAAAAARSAPAPSAKACPFANTACSPSNKACLTTNKPCHPSTSSKASESAPGPAGPTAPQLDPTVLADLAGQFLGTKVDPAQVKSAMDMFSAFVQQASAAQASAQSAQPAQASAPAAGPAEFGGLEGLLSTLFGGAQTPAQPQASSSKASAVAPSSKPSAPATSSAKPVASAQPTTSAAPSASPFDPLAPLRAQLATRLNTEEEAEIRDTMHAIMLSLQDQEEKFKAGSGAGSNAMGSGSKTNTTRDAAASKPDIIIDTNKANGDNSSASDAKGKGRASPEPPRTPTSQDIAASLDTVRNIDAAFAALSGDFAWPSGLDFTPVSSREASPTRFPGDAASPFDSTSAEDDAASVTSSTSSPLSKLAYTARNQPVRFYEQSLSALLSQLDAVESWGSEEVRRVRREVVGRVGRVLEEVEGEVEGRWGVWVRREMRAERGREDVKGKAEVKVAVENDAVKIEAEAKEADAEKAYAEASPESESQAPSVAESVVTIRPASPNSVTRASEELIETVDAPVQADNAPIVDVTPATSAIAPSVSADAPATSDASPSIADTAGYEVEATDDATQDAISSADPENAAAPSDASISDADVPTSPSFMSSPSVDTFLLPAEPEEAPTKKVAHAEGTDSDWSEVEA
ncbi:hypothetical protein FB107DRAFT_262585 [Schizophyllum commune]